MTNGGLSTLQMASHPTLAAFTFQEPRRDGAFRVNAIGARARAHYFPPRRFEASDRLQVNEELLEWLDMLDSVRTADQAREVFFTPDTPRVSSRHDVRAT